MIVIGLTGSIATGKTEVAKMFGVAGTPVFDSDARVHQLYSEQSTINLIAKNFPEAIKEGRIDRPSLGKIVFTRPEELKRLEAIIHPLVQTRRQEFIAHWRAQKSPFVILDIPLLFETAENPNLDFTVVVSAAEDIQRKRALARPGMTAEKLAGILARQMPDVEKRSRADFVIENSGSMDQLQKQVDALVGKFKTLAEGRKA